MHWLMVTDNYRSKCLSTTALILMIVLTIYRKCFWRAVMYWRCEGLLSHISLGHRASSSVHPALQCRTVTLAFFSQKVITYALFTCCVWLHFSTCSSSTALCDLLLLHLYRNSEPIALRCARFGVCWRSRRGSHWGSLMSLPNLCPHVEECLYCEEWVSEQKRERESGTEGERVRTTTCSSHHSNIYNGFPSTDAAALEETQIGEAVRLRSLGTGTLLLLCLGDVWWRRRSQNRIFWEGARQGEGQEQRQGEWPGQR